MTCAAFAQGIAVISGQACLGMNLKRGFQQSASVFIGVDCINNIGNDRNAGKLADSVGRGDDLVAQFATALLISERLGAQHQMRKVYIPVMRRYVWALGQIAEIAKIAVVNDLPVVLALDSIDLHGRGFVHQVEQFRKRVAQVDATATSVTNVKNTFQFVKYRSFVVKPRLILTERVARGCLETAFTGYSRHV